MKFINHESALSFDDVLIEPTFTDVLSRLDVDTSVCIGNICLSYPLISAPMDTVTEVDMVCELSRLGCLALLHRFAKTDTEITDMIAKIIKKNPAALVVPSVGVGTSGIRLFEIIKDFDNDHHVVDGFCIDVANGHTKPVAAMIELIKCEYPDLPVIAGNIATLKGFEFLAEAGATAVRTGIGGGSICTTRRETGCGLPTFASVLECSRSSHAQNVVVIADGGIRYPADIAKALGAGARAVMCGSIFSATVEAPGALVIDNNGNSWKNYRGMASREIQEEKRGGMKSGTTAEGISTYVRCKGPVEDVVNRFVGGLRSSMTYVNARDIKQFQENAKFRKITHAGLVESHAHIENSIDKPNW